MHQSDKNKFASAFQTMCEIFGKESTKIMLAGYFKALEQFPIESVEKGISKAIGTCRYFPKPVELIDMIPGGKPLEIGSSAEIEADKILCHLNIHGATKYPELTDPVTKHLMTNRWPYQVWAKDVLTSELVWWKKEFVLAYKAYNESDLPLQINAPEEVLKIVDGIG